jgi:hypothetical protein
VILRARALAARARRPPLRDQAVGRGLPGPEMLPLPAFGMDVSSAVADAAAGLRRSC